MPLLVVVAVALIFPSEAAACSCGSFPKVQEAYGYSAFVGLGRVTEVTDQWTGWMHIKDWFRGERAPDFETYKKEHGFRVTFQVLRVWEGNQKTVRVFTGRGGGDCGLRFVLGESYLIYAPAGRDGSLSVNLCGRVMPAAAAKADIQELAHLVNGRP